MLIGLGMDLERIDRFRQILVKRKRLIPQVFTEKEQHNASEQPDPALLLTAAFTIKEAVMKALGKTWTDSGVYWTDIELTTSVDHSPVVVKLSGETLKCQQALGADHVVAQLCVHDPYVLAQVWLMGPEVTISV